MERGISEELGRLRTALNWGNVRAALDIVDELDKMDIIVVGRCSNCFSFEKGSNGVLPLCANPNGINNVHESNYCSNYEDSE